MYIYIYIYTHMCVHMYIGSGPRAHRRSQSWKKNSVSGKAVNRHWSVY